MTKESAIYDANLENFPVLVIENSRKGPVVVNFGTPTAAPCRLALERLSSLVTEFGGRFLLVRVNTDDQKTLAQQCGVQSVPTTQVYIAGESVETVRGAESETGFRKLLQKYLVNIADPARVKALAAYQSGDTEQALTLLAQAALENPHDVEIPLDIAKLLMREKRHQQAADLLLSLPDEIRKQQEIVTLLGHLDFIVAAAPTGVAEAPEKKTEDNPEALDTQFQLAARQLLFDNYEAALDLLYKMYQQDPAYGEARAKRGMLTIFSVLGDNNDLVQSYRQKLLETVDTGQG